MMRKRRPRRRLVVLLEVRSKLIGHTGREHRQINYNRGARTVYCSISLGIHEAHRELEPYVCHCILCN